MLGCPCRKTHKLAGSNAQANAPCPAAGVGWTLSNNILVNGEELGCFYTPTLPAELRIPSYMPNLTCTVQPAANIGTSDFTLEGWIYPVAYPAQPNLAVIVSNEQACVGTNQFALSLLPSGFVQFRGLNVPCSAPGPRPDAVDGNGYSSALTTATTVATGKWHHIALIRQGTTISLYLDGVLSSQCVTTGIASQANGLPIQAGARLNGCGGGTYRDYFNGMVLFNYSNVAFSAAQVTLIAAQQTGPAVTVGAV